MSERKPTCPECGGHRFSERSRIDIVQEILSWHEEEPSGYDLGQVDFDTCESYDEHQYACLSCGEIDLDITDLFPEE